MILSAESVSKVFSDNGFEALRSISVDIGEGESVGIVGESGSGKSTLGSIIGGLEKPTGGIVRYRGKDIASMRGQEWRHFRRFVQYIFQDPKGAMNPFFTLRSVLAEPLRINFPELGKAETECRAADILESVGLSRDMLRLHPYEISGGEAQRVVIARALLLEPEVIIADECVSALDPSIQAEVMDLLCRIRESTGAAFLFISHDLSLVRSFCSRMYVMLHGRIVECLDCDKMMESAKSEYTRMLLRDAYGYQSDGDR